MKRASLVMLAVALGSAGLLAWSASGAVGGAPPVTPDPPTRGPLWSHTSEKAFYRRALVIAARPGAPRTGAIYQSAMTADGWSLFPGAPSGAAEMTSALARLAQRAADTFSEERRTCDPAVERALTLFGVKTILFDPIDGGYEVRLPVERPDAEPVARLDRDAPAAAVNDPVALAAALGTSETLFRDWEHEPGPWGGAITVEAATAGRFVFPYAAEGAVVLVDGKPVLAERAGPLLVLTLPAGRPHVEIGYGGDGARSWIPIAGAAGFVIGMIGFFLAARPTAAEVEAAADAQSKPSA